MERSRTGATLLLEQLHRCGVEVAFGYPGGAIMPLYDAMLGGPVAHYLVRHEQGAAFAAGGYARASGRLGVCVATSGPGATNLITGLTDALMDSVPVLAITGQVRSSLLGTDAFQEADVTALTAACTKYNTIVTSVDDLPRAVERCVRIALHGRPGPVLLDVTNDVLKSAASAPTVRRPQTRSGRRTPDEAAAASAAAGRAAEIILKSRRPMLVVGGGCRAADSVAAFRRLVALLGAPSVATINGLGAADPADEHHLGMFGMHGHKAANIAVSRADCILALGMRFDDRVTGDVTRFAQGKTIMHCDIDASEIGKIVPADVALVGGVARTIQLLIEAVERSAPPDLADWRDEVERLRRPLPRARNEDGALSATDLLDAFAALVDRDAIVTTDVGQHQMWAAQRLRPSQPRNFLTSAGLGAMGFGLPAAVGAQVARPDAQVIAIVGDGGLQMTMHEFATIRRYELPVKILVLDNRHLGMVRQWQELFYDRRIIATDLWDNPDFCAIAGAYGIPAGRVAHSGDLLEAIRTMLHAPGPYVLHAACHPADNCFPMVPPGKHLDEVVEQAG